jgi:pimeloyl-ACP methyl ester carboxylesterase
MQKVLHSWIGPVVSRFINKESFRASFTKIFGDKTPPSAHEIDVLWGLLERKEGKYILHQLLRYLDDRITHGAQWLGAMQATQVPMGFINGLDDPVSGAHMLEAFQQLLPNSPTAALPVGHYPQLEAPEKVTELLSLFLSQQRFK